MIAKAEVKDTNFNNNSAGENLVTSQRGCHKISEVAKKNNLTLRTLRYYEEIGLITPFSHSHGTERMYSDSELTKIIKIKEMQDLLGFKLTEIKEILDIESKFDDLKTEYHSANDVRQKVRILENALSTNKELIESIDQRILKLKRYKKDLQMRQERIMAKLNTIK